MRVTNSLKQRLHAAGILPEDASRCTILNPQQSCITSTKACVRISCSPEDKDYIVRDNEVVLIDEFTGRMMTGSSPV